ncbi:MAG TPA: prepilin-type N-terminal cleavage/methylation domain-containing protein [Planctomycetota bacterium]|nr:prepilin-type N-terminal cleavage/methylation domain-containing protein [Planctomycetota bacterium]
MHSRRKKSDGFTLVELLIVIAIIAILAGFLMPLINQARWQSKIAACTSNLRQLNFAIENYKGKLGSDTWYPPWLTYLGDPRRKPGYINHEGKADHEAALARTAPEFVEDPKAFICPADETAGTEGNRHSGWHWKDAGANSTPFDEFQNPDVDWHEDWDFTSDNKAHDKVPCSYLYELCSEECEWAKDTLDAGWTPQSDISWPENERAPEMEWLKRVGNTNEWVYSEGPDKKDFMVVADMNGDGSVSWGEIKIMCLKGASVSSGGSQFRLPKMEGKLPVIRCYWHLRGTSVDRNSTDILNLNDGGHVSKGHFMWQRDFDMFAQ